MHLKNLDALGLSICKQEEVASQDLRDDMNEVCFSKTKPRWRETVDSFDQENEEPIEWPPSPQAVPIDLEVEVVAVT